MLSYIALLPGVLAVGYLGYHFSMSANQSGRPRAVALAFIYFYLPSLIMLPQMYSSQIKGLPDLSFAQSAILPIFIIALFIPSKPTFRVKKSFPILDLFVIGYVFFSVGSEYVNAGSEEQSLVGSLWVNTLWHGMLDIIFPYYLAKWFIHPYGFSDKIAKRIILLTLITIILCAYEWRFVVNAHIHLLKYFFPDQAMDLPTPSYRFGWVRISGPFVHPILFGTMIATALLLNYWVTKNRLWKKHFIFLPFSSKTKGYLLTLMLFVGLILTFSRGPLFGLFLGGIFLGIGFSKKRFLFSLTSRLTLLTIIGIVFYQVYLSYSGMSRNIAESQLASTAIYRIELIGKYIQYVYEKPWWGWGLKDIPDVKRYESVDNNFLWIALKYGAVAMGLLLAAFVFIGARLINKGSKITRNYVINRSLAFTLFAIFFMQGATYLTVYMGGQNEPIFFLLLGWAEGFLRVIPKECYIKQRNLRPQLVSA